MPIASEPATATSRSVTGLPVRRRAPGFLPGHAFDLYPTAVMVCDRRGRVVAANARMRAELGTADPVGASCCALLGCGRPGSELEDGCITAHALERGEPGEEVFVDSAAGRVHVSATPLYRDHSHVVVELRADPPAARLRLRLYTLGRLQVATDAGPLSGPWLDQRAGQLLRYLASERRRFAPADAVAEAIWPQAGPAAGTSVRHFVHVLREHLEPRRPRGAESSYVVCRRGGYALAPECVWVDADEFEAEARQGLMARAAGDIRGAESRLVRALRLYRGDFLADDPYAEWALAEREQLRATVCDVLRALAEIRGEGPEGAACLERLADMEPFDTDVQRCLLASWLRQGRRSRAARHYEAFRWRLMREFGERPGFDLAELAAGSR